MRRKTAVLGVHLLLVALSAGAIAVWGSGTDPAREELRVSLPDPDPRLPVLADTLSIVRPPGLVVLDTTEHEQGADLETVMPMLEADTLDAAGAVSVKAWVARDGEFTTGVWQIAVRDSADPAAALRAADRLYAAGGWRRAVSDREGLYVRQQLPTARTPLAAYRAHYVYGPYVIRIEAYGPDASRVDREFTQLADRQLAETPPDASP